MADCIRKSLLFAVAVLAIPAVAEADAGLPMIAVYLPPAWFALPLIILLEAAVGVWRWRIPIRRALDAQARANCISTLVGLPVTWIVLSFVEAVFFDRGVALDSRTHWIYAVILQAPWLAPPERESAWMVPAAVGVLTIPFYLVSVLLEARILRRRLPDLPASISFSWAWSANLLSYAFLLSLMAVARLWPAPFELMYALLQPVTYAVIMLVFFLGSVVQTVRGAL